MKTKLLFFLLLAGTSLFAQPEQTNLSDSKVDFQAFMLLSQEAYEHRESRLVELPAFLEMLKDEQTILLDTRSKEAYERKHIKGAVHLNFSDFTAGKLKKIIPSKATRILIYCNNNFGGDPENFATKAVPLALNVPTFINLYGYGYENIYELANWIPVDHDLLEFAGTDAVK